MNAPSCQLQPAQPLGEIALDGKIVANDSVCGLGILVLAKILASDNKEQFVKLVA